MSKAEGMCRGADGEEGRKFVKRMLDYCPGKGISEKVAKPETKKNLALSWPRVLNR